MKRAAGAARVGGPALDGTRYFYLGADVAMTRLTDGHHMFVDPHDRTVGSHGPLPRRVLGIVEEDDRQVIQHEGF